jgi:hypothetical protein
MKQVVRRTAWLAAMALVVSAGTAHAGGGGFGNPGGLLLFQCYVVQHGTAPPHVLEFNDQFTDPAQGPVGRLRMVCAPADFQVVNAEDVNVVLNPDHLTCYDGPSINPIRSDIEVRDAFGTQTVTVQPKSRFICVQAEKTCLGGGCLTLGPPPPPEP